MVMPVFGTRHAIRLFEGNQILTGLITWYVVFGLGRSRDCAR